MSDIDQIFKLQGIHCYGSRHGPDGSENGITILDCVPTGTLVCPVCGSRSVYVDKHLVRVVQDLNCAGNKVFLSIDQTRYRCQEPNPSKPSGICGNTFAIPVEMIGNNSRITKRFRDVIVEMSLNRSFLSVANEVGVSDMTVRRAVEDYFNEKEEWRKQNFYCPVGIGIDENHISGQYCLVITDNDQHTLLDMFRDKDPETVRSVLKQLKEKDRLRYVTMDLSLEYKAAVREIFGQKVVIIADRFHLQKLITTAMMDTLANLESGKEGDSRKGFLYNRQLLRKNLENLTDEDKDRMSRMFKAIPGLCRAYALKEAFRSIYNYKNRTSAENAFDRFCKEVPEDTAFNPFRKTINTIKSWYNEMFSYFDYDRASNGFTEAENGLISRRNIIGNGYSFKIIRGFALYGKSSTAFRPNHQLDKPDTANPNYSRKKET